MLKIGELAKGAGCQAETIRFYEREGLLPPPRRSEGNFRLYDDSHLDRLQFIRHCRSLDMNLDEVRALLLLRETPQQDCGNVNALLEGHINEVQRRIEELTALKSELQELRARCGRGTTAEHCAILQQLAERRPPATAAPPCNGTDCN